MAGPGKNVAVYESTNILSIFSPIHSRLTVRESGLVKLRLIEGYEEIYRVELP